MTLLLIVLLVVLSAAVVLILSKYGKLELVAHAKLLFKAWSVWLASVGSALMAWVQSFPDTALSAWNMLPPDVKSFLPPNYLSIIASALVALAVLSQFIRQKKLNDKKEGFDNDTNS